MCASDCNPRHTLCRRRGLRRPERVGVVTLAMAAGPPPPLEPSPLPTFAEEGFGEKFLRKTRENPLVPLGEGGAGGGGTEAE